MNGQNTFTREQFLKGITHPRKNELATMILDGASFEEMEAKGYGRINIIEMAREIALNVEGQQDLKVGVPKDEAESEATAEKKSGPEASDSSGNVNRESASSTESASSDASNESDRKEDGSGEQTSATGEEDANTAAAPVETDDQAAKDAANAVE